VSHCSRVIGRIAPTRRAQGNPPAPTPAGGSAASKRWSTRNFGEYAFLEDSRYASQAENARRKNSHTVATVSSSELGKSAPSAAHRCTKSGIPPLEFTHEGTPRDASVAATALRKHECADTLPHARTRRHRDGGQCVVLVNTLFWKILVTRVKRKMHGTRKSSSVRSSSGRFTALLRPFHRSRSRSRPVTSRGDDQRTYRARSSRAE